MSWVVGAALHVDRHVNMRDAAPNGLGGEANAFVDAFALLQGAYFTLVPIRM